MKWQKQDKTFIALIAALLVYFFVLLAHAAPAMGSVVRGRLDRVDRYGKTYPASGIAVSLSHPRYGRSSFVYSGSDGMYYFKDIPSDAFTLEVWLTNQNVLRFAIKVQPQPFTDIPPIRVQ